MVEALEMRAMPGAVCLFVGFGFGFGLDGGLRADVALDRVRVRGDDGSEELS
jgi:hypothetical protein